MTGLSLIFVVGAWPILASDIATLADSGLYKLRRLAALKKDPPAQAADPRLKATAYLRDSASPDWGLDFL